MNIFTKRKKKKNDFPSNSFLKIGKNLNLKNGKKNLIYIYNPWKNNYSFFIETRPFSIPIYLE